MRSVFYFHGQIKVNLKNKDIVHILLKFTHGNAKKITTKQVFKIIFLR